MANFFKEMENERQRNFEVSIDWKSLPSERSIEIPHFLNLLRRERPRTLLDIGFAGGFYQPEILKLKDIEYTGLDFDMSRIIGQSLCVDSDMKAAWRQILTKFKYIFADIVNCPEEILKASYDMVVAISTIEHIVPAGYALNFTDLDADLKAVENMKKMVKQNGSLLLTFPVGQSAHFFNPTTNRNAVALKKLDIFKEGQHDQMFYASKRIEQLIGDWAVINKRFWINIGQVNQGDWKECNEEVACSVKYNKSSEAVTVCILHMRKP